ncbi:MAG: hypothetical protein ACYDDQ_12380 [Vulcanimicrobiaceae bacterium]
MNLALHPATGGDLWFVERVYFDTQRRIIEELFGWRGDALERAKFEEPHLPQHTSTGILHMDKPS